MGNRNRYIINFLLIPVLLLSCNPAFENFSKEECITINLPVWPPEEKYGTGYPALSGWQISIFSRDNTESLFLPAENCSFTKKTNKSDVMAILARPVTFSGDKNSENLFFMPAGSVYPHLAVSEQLQLTWENGFAAETIRNIYAGNCEELGGNPEKARIFLSKFNWHRFSEIVAEKSLADFYDPWKLDRKKMISYLTGGAFSAIRLNSKPFCLDSIEETLNPNFPLSPYIPNNRHIQDQKALPLFNLSQSGETDENRFLLNKDLLLLILCRDSKKISETTVFMPKKMNRDSLCKKELNVF